MILLRSTAACLVFAATPCAQSYTVMPPSHDTEEGNWWTTSLAVQPQFRVQWADGEANAMAIKGLALRPNNDDLSKYALSGRRYASAEIKCSDGDHLKQDRTFANNVLGTPTTVYQGMAVFPAFTKSGTGPAPWSIKFPFSVTYQHTPVRDLLLDMTFRGGSLDNKTTWLGHQPYHLDNVNSNPNASSRGFEPVGGPGCRDTSATTAATSYPRLFCYGSRHPSASFRNKMYAYAYGLGYPSSTAVVSAIGLQGHAAGVAFPGVSCSKLHVDFGFPYVLSPGMTQSDGVLFNLFLGYGNRVPTNKAWVGIEVFTQTAWLDSVQGTMRLSVTGMAKMPELPVEFRRAYTLSGSEPLTQGWASIGSASFAIARYTN